MRPDVLGRPPINFDVNDPLNKYYPNETGHLPKLKLLDVLHMSTGLPWVEDYENNPLDSNTTKMLYVDSNRDMARYTVGTAQRGELSGAGTKWQYNSGNSNVLMGVLKQAFLLQYGEQEGTRRYLAFPFEFFKSIGMTNTAYELDGSGTFVGSSYIYATARDFARFGFLFLNDGKWGEDQILPPGWVSMSRRLAPGYLTAQTTITDDADYTPWPAITDTGVGAAHFWLNLPIKKPDSMGRVVDYGKPYPAVPDDAYAAMGHWGQSIFVIPSKDLVIVRLGEDRDYQKNGDLVYAASHRFDVDQFLSLALDCFGGKP